MLGSLIEGVFTLTGKVIRGTVDLAEDVVTGVVNAPGALMEGYEKGLFNSSETEVKEPKEKLDIEVISSPFRQPQ